MACQRVLAAPALGRSCDAACRVRRDPGIGTGARAVDEVARVCTRLYTPQPRRANGPAARRCHPASCGLAPWSDAAAAAGSAARCGSTPAQAGTLAEYWCPAFDLVNRRQGAFLTASHCAKLFDSRCIVAQHTGSFMVHHKAFSSLPSIDSPAQHCPLCRYSAARLHVSRASPL